MECQNNNHIIDDQLSRYDFESLQDFLTSKPEYTNIAVQFEDKITHLSIQILNKIKHLVPGKFYFIVGDTSYSQCCADDIAALHLKANLIIRVGDSCLTKNKQLPVYFLYECENWNDSEIRKLSDSLIHFTKDKTKEDSPTHNTFVFYHYRYTKIFDKIKTNTSDIAKLKVSTTPYRPDIYLNYNQQEDLVIYSQIFNKVTEIKKNDTIIYMGEEDDKVLCEISLRFMNSNKIYLIDKEDYSIKDFSASHMNSVYYKRFNLIEKAKESETFGIIIGSLSINGLNEVIEEVKRTLKVNNRKHYSFLLGKITLEKLSNFVDFIDCFILVACPFSDNYNFKTLMKPLVSPLDIEIAYNSETFKWDMSYTFDTNYILNKSKDQKSENKSLNDKANSEETISNISHNINSLTLKESEKNQALAHVFSVKTLANYDKRNYKGLEVQESKREVEKFKLGKTGIPLKYEDII